MVGVYGRTRLLSTTTDAVPGEFVNDRRGNVTFWPPSRIFGTLSPPRAALRPPLTPLNDSPTRPSSYDIVVICLFAGVTEQYTHLVFKIS